jgi:outer membrane protein assembly factor BamB
MKHLGILVAVLGGLGLAQTASTPSAWTMYQYVPSHNAVLPGPSTGYQWTFTTQGNIVGGLALANGVLYVESFDHHLYALDPTNGKVLWSFDTGQVIMTTPIVADGVVVVGSGTNAVLDDLPDKVDWGVLPPADAVYALNAQTGALLWKHVTVGEDMPSPVYTNGTIIWGNGHDVAQAANLQTGQILWRTPLQGVVTMSSANMAGGMVYMVAGMGPHSTLAFPVNTYALNPQTGAVIWKAPYGDGDCSPTVGDGLVFVEGAEQVPGSSQEVSLVDALDAQTGQLVWSYVSAPGYNDTTASNEQGIAGVYHDGILYQALPMSDQFAAFDAKTGKVLWITKTAGPIKMSAVVHQGKVYAGDGAGNLYVFDAKTGAILYERHFPAPFTPSSPVIWGDTLFIATGYHNKPEGTLYAIPLESLEASAAR